MPTYQLDRKIPVYLLVAPIGEFMTDMPVSGIKLLGRLRMLIVEDTGANDDHCLVGRLKAAKIVGPGQELVAIGGADRLNELLARVDGCVNAREPFGLISDSGMCCFVDPGIAVVRHLLEHHADKVELVPIGASSAMDAAIMVSGVDCSRFVFIGHFPELFEWFTDSVRAGMPGVAYVRGDSLKAFWAAAKKEFGASKRVRVTVLRNLRMKARRAMGQFRLSEPVKCLDELTECPEAAPNTFSNNFVVILDVPDANPITD